jgi:hypothetical protein
MEIESCGICGGDGRVSNAFGGSSTSCPACRGTGRRAEPEGFRDVTKTKPSHHRKGNAAAAPVKPTWPATRAGRELADAVQISALSDQNKARLVREIIEYEDLHDGCTQTFSRKVRKQLRT